MSKSIFIVVGVVCVAVLVFMLFPFNYSGKAYDAANAELDSRQTVTENRSESVEATTEIIDSMNGNLMREPDSGREAQVDSVVHLSDIDSTELTALEEEIIKRRFEELMNDKTVIKGSLESAGFSETAADAFASGEPKALISIDGLPIDVQESVIEALEFRDREGYLPVSEFDAEEITGVMNYVAGTDVSEANIIFEPSTVPDVIYKAYEYIGYTHPNYSANPDVAMAENGTIRRIYASHTDQTILLIEESPNVAGAQAVQIEEYVNMDIEGQPAIFSILKSDSDKTYASLNWTNETHAFALYQIGDLSSSSANLTTLANAINQ